MPTQVLSVTLVQFEWPANISFNCNKCGLCCGDTSKKTRHVLLLKSDAQKIKEHIKQPIKQFAHKIQGKAPYIFEMRKNPTDGKCVFLRNNQCTIYEHRPLICKFYPIELTTDETGKPIFKATLECPGICCQDTEGVGKKLGEDYFSALLDLAYTELSNTAN